MRKLVASLLLIALSGCASVSQTLLPPVQEPAAVATADSDQNPYLQSRRAVSSDARRRFDAANAALAVEDWGTAQADLEWLIEHYPRLSGPYLNLALMYQALDNAEEAETWFQAALEANPSNLDGYNHYAIFLREQGRFEESEQVYLAALAVWEAHPATHRNLGVLYDLYRGDVDQALAHYYRYQALTENEDRVVAGWIIALERQQTQLVQRGEQ